MPNVQNEPVHSASEPVQALERIAYLVGGAVRDTLLGLPVNDRDHVLVGVAPQTLLDAGFRQVGKDFPVFLHPDTQEEFALARTERKTGPGYGGFTVHAGPDVTLEQDLGRRDLTINAMAMADDGSVVDPYGGRNDLDARVFRHVNETAFIEDPVRILRLARFMARFDDFTIAAETLDLARTMVRRGDMTELVPERVWQELSRGLMESRPDRMINVLRDTGALKALIPELDRLWGVPQTARYHPEIDTGIHVCMVLQQAALARAPLDVRWACLMHDLGKGLTPQEILPAHHGHEAGGVPLVRAVCDRLKVPNDCRDLSILVCRDHTNVHTAGVLNPGTMVSLFERADGLRKPDRFERFLQACELDARGRLGLDHRPYPQRPYLSAGLRLARSIDAGAIASVCKSPQDIPGRIHAARTKSLRSLRFKEFEVLAEPPVIPQDVCAAAAALDDTGLASTKPIRHAMR